MTGEAQRTISSVAVVGEDLRSRRRRRAFWSGCSVSACRAWAMAVRVVSLPAMTSRTKNEASSCWVSFSDSISAFTSALVMSSIGLLAAVLAELLHDAR